MLNSRGVGLSIQGVKRTWGPDSCVLEEETAGVQES